MLLAKAKRRASDDSASSLESKASEILNDKNLSNDEKLKKFFNVTETLESDGIKEHKKILKEKNKHKIYGEDDDDEIDTSFIPFTNERNLMKEFLKSPYGHMVETVFNETEIPYNIKIDNDTLEIPMIDYATGVRLVCIDTESVSHMNISPALEMRIPFSYKAYTKENNKSHQTYYIYGDSIRYAYDGVVHNVIKLIGGITDKRRRVKLFNNYNLMYTTGLTEYRQFTKKYSPTPGDRTKIASQGGFLTVLVAYPKKSKQGKKSGDMYNEMYRLLNRSTDQILQDNNIYAACAIKYFAMRNNTVANNIEYTITDYQENPLALVDDGLEIALSALYKEHTVKYPGCTCQFFVEYDRTLLPSQTMYKSLVNGMNYQIIVSSRDYRIQDKNKVFGIKILNNSYIKNPNVAYGSSIEDKFRVDIRIFKSKNTLINMFSDTIRDLNINVSTEEGKKILLTSLDYIECKQPLVATAIATPVLMTYIKAVSNMLFNVNLSNFQNIGGNMRDQMGQMMYMQALGQNVDNPQYAMMKMMMDKFKGGR